MFHTMFFLAQAHPVWINLLDSGEGFCRGHEKVAGLNACILGSMGYPMSLASPSRDGGAGGGAALEPLHPHPVSYSILGAVALRRTWGASSHVPAGRPMNAEARGNSRACQSQIGLPPSSSRPGRIGGARKGSLYVQARPENGTGSGSRNISVPQKEMRWKTLMWPA